MADGVDDAGHQQIRNNGSEQAARAEDNEVGGADGFERGLVGDDFDGAAKLHVGERAAGMACNSLAFDIAAIASARDEGDRIERGGIYVTAGVQQPLANGDGLGKRPCRLLKRGEHEVAERVVVGEGEAGLECARERVLRVRRHGTDAFADISRRGYVGLVAQNARRSAVVCHGDHSGGLRAH